MKKGILRRILRFIGAGLAAAGLFLAGTRPAQWIWRLRAMRFVVRALVLLWTVSMRHVWKPTRNAGRRIRAFIRRREIVPWLLTWAVCAWIGLAIVQEIGFVTGLMIGLLMAVVYTVICFISPLTGLLLWLVSSPFLTLFVAIKPLQGMPVITGDRYCLMILALVYLVQWNRARDELRSPYLHGAMFVFVLVMLISVTGHEYPKTNAQKVLDTYAVPFITYLFARRWVTTHRSLAIALAAIMIVGLYFSLMGIPEHFMGRLVFATRRAGWVEQDLGTVRVQGPAESPSEFGLVVLASGLLGLAGLATEHRRSVRVLCGAVSIIAMLAIALTLRRSVYLGLLTGLPVMLLGTRRTRRLTFAILCAGALAFAAYWGAIQSSKTYQTRLGDMGPIYNRMVIYATSWEIIKANPVTGVGLQGYGEAKAKHLTSYKGIPPAFYGGGQRTTHNSYLRIAVEGGLLAFLPYMVVLVSMVVIGRRIYKQTDAAGLLGRDVVVVFLAFLAACLQDALTDDIFWFSHYLCTLWYFFFGAIVGVFCAKRQPIPEAGSEYTSARLRVAPGTVGRH